MKELAYYDGKTGTPDEVMIPFNDRAHFFGDGVYDAAPGANGKVYLLKDHLDRFYSSAAALGIRVPMEKEALGGLLTELLAKVEGDTHFVYWQVTRGVEARQHDYSEDLAGKIWVMISPAALADFAKPLTLISRPDTRFYHCNIKTLNLLPSVMAAQAARRAGADETVFYRDGIVTECAHSNISILKDGVFISHPNDNLILRGIAKTHLIGACYELGIPVIERNYSPAELAEADELIVSSSSKFALRANILDGRGVGGKDPETFSRLQEAVIREFEEYTGLPVPRS